MGGLCYEKNKVKSIMIILVFEYKSALGDE